MSTEEGLGGGASGLEREISRIELSMYGCDVGTIGVVADKVRGRRGIEGGVGASKACGVGGERGRVACEGR